MPNLLSSAEGAFRLILDEAKDYAIFVLDTDGRIESWNAGAERIFALTAGEAIGRHFAMLFVPDDREAGVPEKELAKARDEGRAEDTRWHLRADGTPFFADGVTTAIRDERGVLLGFAKIARDITERYRTQQRLAAQLTLTKLLNLERPIPETARNIMQTVCENLGWEIGALWRIDPAAQTMSVYEEWHGPSIAGEAANDLSRGVTFRRGEGLPGEVWDSGNPLWISNLDDPRRFPRSERAKRAGVRAAFAFPIVHEGRILGVMEFFSREAREPDQALLPVMALIGAQIGDYVERLRGAAALRESEEKYRLISETTPDAIFTIDAESNIVFCNPAVERIFGWTPAEITGKPLDVIIPERFREAHRRGVERYMQTKQPTIAWDGAEFIALHKSGHEFPVEISFGAANTGSRMIFTGYARDITER
ncbi:MAG TPA: PAS domain S-box protein, partial [Thermoanaerobaculia bacterium]|nr:PAS domain S-box protein [Thermoanaerobaculia bacterium]